MATTTSKNLLRCFTSSSLNPYCKSKSISVTKNGDLGAVSVYFFSTGTAAAQPSYPSHSDQPDTLSRRLMVATRPKNPNPKQTISQVLKQWVDEGRDVDLQDVRNSIKMFRNLRRYDHAMEISEWMGSIANPNFTYGRAAIHLDLIYKVHGLEQAVSYFERTPEDSKVPHLYGALLNCYVQEKLLDEAEAIFEKMRELNYTENLSYNCMLSLYSQMGKSIKMISLVQEMENKGIDFDKFTYSILLNAYASKSDVMGMEKLLMKMEADPLVVMDWKPYSISANGYLKAADIVKAVSMLKKCEHIINVGAQRGRKSCDVAVAYEVLMTLYASLGRKNEVCRIWNMHKKPKKWFNRSYTCMMCSLLKLEDTDIAQKLLDEWFSKHEFFDIRIPNLLLAAFCKKGQMKEAESIVNNLLERGFEANARTWHYMALGYLKNNQMEDAVRMTKKGLCTNPQWRPHGITVLASCFEYLKKKGDSGEAEEILGLLEKGGKFPADFLNLISKYMRKGEPSVLVQMKNVSDIAE